MLVIPRRFQAGMFFLGLCIVGTACEQGTRPGLAGLLPGVEPFEQLANVRLDMTAEELRTLRPGVRNAPYLGFQDSIGAYLVGFQFPGNVSDNMETPADDRLTWVSAERRFASDAEAEAAYRIAVQKVADILGTPVECFSVVPEPDTRHFARWTADSTHVYVQYATAHGPQGSERARMQPAGVWTVVSRDPPLYPKRLSPAPEPCPTTAR